MIERGSEVVFYVMVIVLTGMLGILVLCGISAAIDYITGCRIRSQKPVINKLKREIHMLIDDAQLREERLTKMTIVDTQLIQAGARDSKTLAKALLQRDSAEKRARLAEKSFATMANAWREAANKNK